MMQHKVCHGGPTTKAWARNLKARRRIRAQSTARSCAGEGRGRRNERAIQDILSEYVCVLNVEGKWRVRWHVRCREGHPC